jgi:mono/diheme cytochrome c family protein
MMMMMKANQIKIIALILFAMPILFVTLYGTTPTIVGAAVVDEPAAVYKAKCAMCHSPKAEKFFDATKSDDVHVEAILKGRKGEKPPYMPGFEAKGMTADEAKGLGAYMKSLKAAN